MNQEAHMQGGGTPNPSIGKIATPNGLPRGEESALGRVAGQLTPGNATSIINNISNSFTGAPLTPRQHFFDQLQSWETTLPLTNLWMVFFDIPPVVKDDFMNHWGENHLGIDWGVDAAVGRVGGGGSLYGAYGCALAQTVGIPVEQMGIDTVGPVNRGFLKGPVIQQRQSFAALNIEFLETTLSFNDFVLRPWIILASHYGLVKRQQPAARITTDIYIVNLSRAGTEFMYPADGSQPENQRSFVPRKIWLFKDCIPVNIGQETYTYGQSEIDRRDTEWNFRRYQVISPKALFDAFDPVQTESKQVDETLSPGNPVDTTRPTIERKDIPRTPIPNPGIREAPGDFGPYESDIDARKAKREQRRNSKPTNPRKDTPGRGKLDSRGIPQRAAGDDDI